MRAVLPLVLAGVATPALAAPSPGPRLRKATLGASNPSLGLSNPPQFPSSVLVFDPSDGDIQSKIDSVYATNGGYDPVNNGQFVDNRYALLFKPGEYTVDVPVGYYTQGAREVAHRH